MAESTSSSPTQEERTQTQFDASFFEQMQHSLSQPGTNTVDVTYQVISAYFEQADAQLRQSRKMADLWAQSLILQSTIGQIVGYVTPQVTRQVISEIKRNPDLLKSSR